MRLRMAEPSDAAQLAELMYIADVAHYQTSGYALSLGGTRQHQLEDLAKLTVTEARSQFHYSHFDVAEAPDGSLAASVAAFDRAAASESAGNALQQIGWTDDDIRALAGRLGPFDDCYPEEAPWTWTIEHVATLPAYRGQGLIRQLLERALKRGAQQGFKHASVDVFTGNHRAQLIYEAAGFRPISTFGNEPPRRIFNRDPLIRLTRPLG